MKKLTNILPWILLIGFGVILVLLPFHAFLSTWAGASFGQPLVWKSWKEILLLLLLPVVVAYLYVKPEIAQILWSRWINKLVLLFSLIVGIGAILSPATVEAIASGIMFDLRFFALFLLAQIIVESKYVGVEKIKSLVGPALLFITIILGIMAVLQVLSLPKDFLVQFGYDKNSSIAPFILVDENQDALRAFATMRGPNTLGAYLVLPIALALVLVMKQRRNYLAWASLGLGLVALGLTGSRSAWLGAFAAIATIVLLFVPGKKLGKLLLWAMPIGVIASVVAVWLAMTVPVIRLALFHSSPGDPTLLEGSSEQHWVATTTGVADVLAHPFGSGIGTAGPASFYGTTVKLAENYFVQIAQEVGVIGLGAFIAICLALTMQLWRARDQLWPKVLLASLLGLTVINLFLHGWADDPTAMTWWACAGLFAFATGRRIKA